MIKPLRPKLCSCIQSFSRVRAQQWRHHWSQCFSWRITLWSSSHPTMQGTLNVPARPAELPHSCRCPLVLMQLLLLQLCPAGLLVRTRPQRPWMCLKKDSQRCKAGPSPFQATGRLHDRQDVWVNTCTQNRTHINTMQLLIRVSENCSLCRSCCQHSRAFAPGRCTQRDVTKRGGWGAP